jgi:hypothetical protein
MKYLSKMFLLIIVLLSIEMIHSMDTGPNMDKTHNEYGSLMHIESWPATRVLIDAAKNNNTNKIKETMSLNIYNNANDREKFNLYVVLLGLAINEREMDTFKALLEGDRWHCLNKPQQWPYEFDNFYTVYDAIRSRASQRYNDQIYRVPDKTYFDTAVLSGAKTLKQLLEEGYVLPPKREEPNPDSYESWNRYGKLVD